MSARQEQLDRITATLDRISALSPAQAKMALGSIMMCEMITLDQMGLVWGMLDRLEGALS